MKRFLLPALLLLLPFMAQAGQTQLQLDRTNAARNSVGQLEFKGAVVIPAGPVKVGGLSGIQVLPQGRLLFLSDSGATHEATPRYNDAGRLVSVKVDPARKLRDEDGQFVKTRTRFDAEAITRLADGSYLVGFERDHRIEHYADLALSTPLPFAQPQGLALLPRNAGLESLAALPDGRVVALAEGKLTDGAHPLWLWQEGHWKSLSYRSQSGLDPSDAAFLPNGDLLVLERGFNLLMGFRCRIALVPLGSLQQGGVLAGETVAMLESPILSENFEGLAVEKTGENTARLYVVSDNNFNTSQQTILAVFEIKTLVTNSVAP